MKSCISMFNKSLFIFKLLFVSLFVGGMTNIANADEKTLKIAVVNMQKLEDNALISKDMRQKLQTKEKELQQDLIKRKNKIENEFKSLESKRAILSQDELQKKVQKLEGDYQKLQIDEKIYGQTFETSKMITLSEVQDCVKKATNKIANDKYDMVLPLGFAIYINSGKFDDITDKVVDKMNGISKSVNYEKAYKQAKEQMDKLMQSSRK